VKNKKTNEHLQNRLIQKNDKSIMSFQVTHLAAQYFDGVQRRNEQEPAKRAGTYAK